MREPLTAARWRGHSSGTVYRALFNLADPEDAARLRRVERHPEFVAVPVEVDFAPATSGALNRPARELVEVERDRLRGLLIHARDEIARQRDILLRSACLIGANDEPDRSTLDEEDRPDVERMEAMIARVDAAVGLALPQQQPNGEAA